MSWLERLQPGRPCWDDCREALLSLDGKEFPGLELLNDRLAGIALSGRNQPISFVGSAHLPGVEYESHIYLNGEVSTREGNWHDLFNAVCWKTWPQIKSAMNQRHFHAMTPRAAGERGAERDALTLFDECGAVVVSPSHAALEAIRNHSWSDVFGGGQQAWPARYQVFIVGHALLEKLMNPYKSMTANSVLVQAGADLFAAPRGKLRAEIDKNLGKLIAGSKLLLGSDQLSPLPLAGIPGWWTADAQDAGFYSDKSVFRPGGDPDPDVTIVRIDF